MNNIALLIGNTVIYWNQIIVILGIISGVLLVCALRPYTRIKKKAVLFWFLSAAILSYLLSRLLYYDCNPEQFSSFGEVLTGFTDSRYQVMGFILGAILSAWILKQFHLVKHMGNLLDTTFPGVVLTIAVIRLSYLFTGTFHSTLAVTGSFWKRLPFAVSATDAAGNTSFVFAPFFISFLILLLTVLILIFLVRDQIQHPGDLFCLMFTFFMLSEIVLESTRYDSPKLRFLLLDFLNQYVSFISFSMFLCGIGLILVFLVKYLPVRKAFGFRKTCFPLLAFAAGIVCFGVCEYLLQRYTTKAVLFHWLQAVFAALMAVSILTLVFFKQLKHLRQNLRGA